MLCRWETGDPASEPTAVSACPFSCVGLPPFPAREGRGRPCPDALSVLPPLEGLWSVLLPKGAAVSLRQQRPCNYCHLLNMTTETVCN